MLNFARACITFSYHECFTYSFRQFTTARSMMYTLVIDKNNLARWAFNNIFKKVYLEKSLNTAYWLQAQEKKKRRENGDNPNVLYLHCRWFRFLHLRNSRSKQGRIWLWLQDLLIEVFSHTRFWTSVGYCRSIIQNDTPWNLLMTRTMELQVRG